jgi:hypothetical protein
MAKKIRATILDIDGKLRYNIIKSVIDRFNNALINGYYFEATTLMESLICDRLESRLGELKKKQTLFNTIGNNIKELQKIESDEILLKIISDIKEWSNQRNAVIHEAAKIELGVDKDWEIFISNAKQVALNGKKLFYALNATLKKIRKINI